MATIARKVRRLAPAEPMTTLTDMLLAGQTFAYAARLARTPAADRGGHARQWWALAFAAAGVAALAGGIVHALTLDQAPRLRAALWKAVGLATSLASAAMLMAGVYASLQASARRGWAAFAAFKFAVSSVATWRSGNYLLIIVDYAVSMAVLLALQVRDWQRSAAAPWLSGGVLVSFVAAGIQQSELTLHKHFNFNDLYHVVQMGAFHLLYMGARRTHERDERRPAKTLDPS